MSAEIYIEYDDGRLHDSVQVAGEFNEWQSVPLGHDSGTRYAAYFQGAQPGQQFQYKFIVNGEWSLQPGHATIVDSQGYLNHLVTASLPAATNEPHTTSRESEPYDLQGSQLDHNKEQVNGLDQVPASALGNSAAANSTSLTGQGLQGTEAATLQEHAIEREAHSQASGLTSQPATSGSQYATGQYGTGPYAGYNAGELEGKPQVDTGYNLTSNELQKPVEKVPGLDQVSGSGSSSTYGAGYGSTNYQASDPYNLQGSQLEKPTEKVPGLDQVAGTTESSTYGTGHDSTNYQASDPYNLQGSQLEKPTEKVAGLGQVTSGTSSSYGTAAGYDSTNYQASDPYNLQGSQLEKPTEKVAGLDQVTSGTSSSYGTAAGYNSTNYQASDPYNLQGSQLEKPTEKVAGLDQVTSGTSSSYGTGAGYNSTNYQASDPYNLQGSQLEKPTEKVAGLDQINKDSSNGKDSSTSKDNTTLGAGYHSTNYKSSDWYRLQGSQLDKPIERVDPHAPSKSSKTGDETVAASTTAIPGSLPFEQRVVDELSPQQVTESTLSAIGGPPSREAPLRGDTLSKDAKDTPLSASSSTANYVDADSSPRFGETSFDQSYNSGYDEGNYESAEENFDDSDYLTSALQSSHLKEGPGGFDTNTFLSGGTLGATTSGLGSSGYSGVGGSGLGLDTSGIDSSAGLGYSGLGVKSVGQERGADSNLESVNEIVPSRSDRTISQHTARNIESTSSLDKLAADRAVQDTEPVQRSTHPSTAQPVTQQHYSVSTSRDSDEQSQSGHAAPLGSDPSSPITLPVRSKPHTPIDVNTGFPIDSRSSNDQSQSSKSGSTKKVLSHTGVPGGPVNQAPPPAENRNAAVLAAAAKASAFAKQDVAAISKPQQFKGREEHSSGRTNSSSRRPLSTSALGLGHSQKPSTGASSYGSGNTTSGLGATTSAGGLGSSNLASSGLGYSSGQEGGAKLPRSSSSAGIGELRSSSFERERSGATQLQRSNTQKEGKLKRFFKKLGSK